LIDFTQQASTLLHTWYLDRYRTCSGYISIWLPQATGPSNDAHDRPRRQQGSTSSADRGLSRAWCEVVNNENCGLGVIYLANSQSNSVGRVDGHRDSQDVLVSSTCRAVRRTVYGYGRTMYRYLTVYDRLVTLSYRILEKTVRYGTGHLTAVNGSYGSYGQSYGKTYCKY